MNMARMKVLVSILRESSLYETISHEEKVALISNLFNDYPSLSKLPNISRKQKTPKFWPSHIHRVIQKKVA